MPLLTIGISHHTAPIEIRERVALREGDCEQRLRALRAEAGIEEALLLSTCNRTELYCLGQELETGHLIDWIHRSWKIENERLDPFFYIHHDSEAVRHLFRVAGGMDSLVLGESQILGQLKRAWRDARNAKTAGVVIDRMCQHAMSTSKAIRHLSGIGNQPISVAYTAIVLARQLFSNLESRRVLLLGAGEMIELCARHLAEHGVGHLTIANRDIERARLIADSLGAQPIALADLGDALPQADILITSTAAEHAIVTVADIKRALRIRRHRPMFIVDIAVPRDVEPAVDELDDVFLYTIDDLQQVVDENLDKRSEAARGAIPIVDAAVDDFIRWMNGARAADSLQLMRETAHGHSQELVEKALRRLEAGHDPRAVLQQLGSTLTNRILHAPSKHLRQAAEQSDLELLTTINRIFTPEETQNPENESEEEHQQEQNAARDDPDASSDRARGCK